MINQRTITNGNIKTKLVGVSHNNDDGESRQEIIKGQLTKGDALIIKPEHNNPYDSNAVSVWVEVVKGGLFRNKTVFQKQIGFLSREVAAELHEYIMNGNDVTCSVASITGKGKQSCGVNVQIEKTRVYGEEKKANAQARAVS
ncbi:HIRAN domain-containing protein [Salinisphaera sp. LB1]|uniref:HIRAN domain-containing protein n=1 Tax=Salinisphaera sp. LB1 TaxID=2183911 RepID=UPI001314F9FD|nr:HIRAN domain-containing protein [Salinisphaera sp. LB1]